MNIPPASKKMKTRSQSSSIRKKYKCHQCFVCGKDYGSEKDAEAHRKRIHGKERYECSQCNIGFGTKEILQNHKKAQHRPFKCESCSATFNKERIYVSHQMNHVYNLQHSVKQIDAFTVKVEPQEESILSVYSQAFDSSSHQSEHKLDETINQVVVADSDDFLH